MKKTENVKKVKDGKRKDKEREWKREKKVENVMKLRKKMENEKRKRLHKEDGKNMKKGKSLISKFKWHGQWKKAKIVTEKVGKTYKARKKFKKYK